MATTPNRNYPLINNGSASGSVDLSIDVATLLTFIGMVDADVQSLVTALAGKVGSVSPAFSGSPTAPTQPAGDDSNKLATTAFVKVAASLAIANLVAAAPSALDTLNELAAALGNDPNFAATVATQIGLKANSADVYLKTAIDALIADMATKTGAETLANKTLATPVLKLKNSSGAAPTVLGELQWDVTSGRLKVGTGTATKEHAANNREFIAEASLSGQSYVDFVGLSAFETLELDLNYTVSAIGDACRVEVSNDNGATFVTSGYIQVGMGVDEAAGYMASSVSAGGLGFQLYGAYTGYPCGGYMVMRNFNKAARTQGEARSGYVHFSSIRYSHESLSVLVPNGVGACNAIRVHNTAHNFPTGRIILRGTRG